MRSQNQIDLELDELRAEACKAEIDWLEVDEEMKVAPPTVMFLVDAAKERDKLRAEVVQLRYECQKYRALLRQYVDEHEAGSIIQCPPDLLEKASAALGET